MPTAPANLPEFYPESVVLSTPAGEPGGDVTLIWDNVDEWTDGAGITVNLIDPQTNGPTYELTNPADPTAPFTLAEATAGNPFYATPLADNGYAIVSQTFPSGAVTDSADAVADNLTAQTFHLAFTAQRLNIPDFNLAAGDLTNTTVVVLPALYTVTSESRGALDERHFIDVGVLRKFSQGPASLSAAVHRQNEADTLTSLVQEILQHLINLKIAVTATMNIKGLGMELIHVVDPDEWDENGLFKSVMRFEFKANRDR